MPNLIEYVKAVMEEGLASKYPNETSIMKQVAAINSENKNISELYTRIGECYCNLKEGDSEAQAKLDELCDEVKASKKEIKNSKIKIGELLGYTFCETCGEQVDEDALFCNNCGAKMPVKLMPGMVLCPHCSKPVKNTFRFCTYCGMSVTDAPEAEKPEEKKEGQVKTCPNCGMTTTDPDKMFCDGCGTRLPGTERKDDSKKKKKEATHKVCPHCGFKIFDAETLFCDDCGTRLVEEK